MTLLAIALALAGSNAAGQKGHAGADAGGQDGLEGPVSAQRKHKLQDEQRDLTAPVPPAQARQT